MDTGNDKLCAYVHVEVENEDMHWLLAECGTDARSFICESDAGKICITFFNCNALVNYFLN